VHAVMGATTAEKLRGTKVWVPTPGRLQCWVREGVALLALWRSGVSPPLNLGKVRCCILHSGTILVVKFLAFWKLRPINWGNRYIVGPQPKSWEDPSPPVLRLLTLCRRCQHFRCGAWCTGIGVGSCWYVLQVKWVYGFQEWVPSSGNYSIWHTMHITAGSQVSIGKGGFSLAQNLR